MSNHWVYAAGSQHLWSQIIAVELMLVYCVCFVTVFRVCVYCSVTIIVEFCYLIATDV